MAQRVIHIDDMDGETEAAGTVYLALNDKQKCLDLSQEHYDELEKLLAPYMEKARNTDMPRGGRRTPAFMITNGSIVGVASSSNGTAPAANGTTPTLDSEPAPAEVRSWAEANGIPIGEKGRIPEDITTKYKAAKAAEAAAAAEAEKPDDAKK